MLNLGPLEKVPQVTCMQQSQVCVCNYQHVGSLTLLSADAFPGTP